MLTTKSRKISFQRHFHYKKDFQSKANCLLVDRFIAYQVNKFEQVQRGVFPSDEVSIGLNCRGTQVNKFEQVLLHEELPVDRQTDTTENITLPHYVVGGHKSTAVLECG